MLDQSGKLWIVVIVTFVTLMFAQIADAAVTTAWIPPPADGTTYLVDTVVHNIHGQASATGVVGGTGLDLAFVLDSSGSMTSTYSGHTRQWYQQQAAIALVNALPFDTTSVAVIEFDSDANTVRQLTALNPDIALVLSAINSVDASGLTNIGSGINEASSELTSSRHTAGRAQMMIVVSDGATSGSPGTNADNAVAAGIDAIHSVGIPGHSVSTMTDIANGPSASDPSDDNGVYTDVYDLSTLISIFDGTGGNLVGLDHVDITLPDGSVLANHPIDGLGNFVLPDWTMQLGPNVFGVTAYDSLLNSAYAELTLIGEISPSPHDVIPEPASIIVWSLLLALALVGYRRR